MTAREFLVCSLPMRNGNNPLAFPKGQPADVCSLPMRNGNRPAMMKSPSLSTFVAYL